MSELFSLAGKTALVTGATGLLGRRHVHALAAAGAAVAVTDLDLEACAALAEEIRAEHSRDAFGCAADLARPDSFATLRDAVLARWGRLDVLVNNAALNEKVEDPEAPGAALRFENHPLALWEQAIRVNLTGVFLACQTFGAEMVRRGRGSIVNLASTYALVAPDPALYPPPFVKSAAYPVTKSAVLSLTRYLGAYWGRTGVRVNALSPGGVENGQDPEFIARYSARTPLGRMARPTDYEGALVFLASDASSYMTGANLVVDGGWTVW